MRTAIALALLVAGAAPAMAQISPVEGNWACIANIDNTKAGLLTIFAGSYGYASANYGSTASGTGNAQLASDGVIFLDGNLKDKAGIEKGLLGFDDQARDVLTLHTPAKPVLTCRPK
jgi:hypothetical protein